MKAIIRPSKVSGTISAPPSKSYTHRAIIIASLANGISTISNVLESEDTLVTLTALKQLGVEIEKRDNKVKIKGVNGRYHLPKKQVILDVKNSGTSLRLLTGIASLTDGEVIITGTDRLQQRPITELVEALRKLGIEVHTTNSGIRVRGGNLKGGEVTINAKESSQYVSALLLISPFAQNDTTIIVEDLRSAPYVDITTYLMKTFGVTVKKDKNTYFIKSGQRYRARNYRVEGDYSSASYFFTAAAITHSEITVRGLHKNSLQGDRYFLDILKKMGCKIVWNSDMVTVRGEGLAGIEVDLSQYPDIVPALAVVGTKACHHTLIRNIGHLRLKESDRIHSLETELTKMGARVETTDDSICVHQSQLKGTHIETHNDHRIAMSLGVAALVADGKTTIKHAEVVQKSYPNFWDDFKKIGAHIV